MEEEGQNALEVGKEEKKEGKARPEEKGRRPLTVILPPLPERGLMPAVIQAPAGMLALFALRDAGKRGLLIAKNEYIEPSSSRTGCLGWADG